MTTRTSILQPPRHRTLLACLVAAFCLNGCGLLVPKPIDHDALAPVAKKRLTDLIASEAPVTGPISLYEAMARALKYNLDQKIELASAQLRQRQLDLIQLDLLPSFVASGGASTRSNEAAARSRSILTGNQSLEPSTSSDRQDRNADLAVSWDALDFGLSFVRAQQAGDEKLIAIESRRKVVNRILEDVRTSYWRAVSADRTYRQLAEVEGLAQRALRQAEDLEKRRLAPLSTVLAYQRDLLQVQADVQRLQRELSLAKSQLAALMNLPPDADFPLVLPDRTNVFPELPGSADEMVLVGLRYRPELREAAYRQRINQREMTAGLLKMLPSIKGLLGVDYDSNSFLTNASWASASARVTWNLLEVCRYPARKQALQAEADVLSQRDLALTMAVLTQVHVARVRFLRLSDELNVVRRSQSVEERILELARNGFKARSVSQQNLVKEEMNAVLADVRYDSAYADLQNAYANLYASMGLDNFDIDFDGDMSLKAMTVELEKHWTERAILLPALPEKNDDPS